MQSGNRPSFFPKPLTACLLGISLGLTAGAEPPAAAAKTLKVERFDIVGNTLLDADLLRQQVSPYEGKELSLAQMKELAKNLTALYQKHGYFLVRVYVPQQAFQNQKVELRVLEGRFGKVSVQGARHYSEEYLRQRFLEAFEGESFRNDRFQRALLLMNELPDLKVKAVMSPGEAEGTSDVVLQVEDRLPVHGGVDYNNYGTNETGQNRVGLSFDAGNLLSQADSLSLRGVLGFPGRQNSFYQLNYQTPLDLDGTSLTLGYANGAFAVSQGLGAILDVRGRADIFTLAASRALERELEFSSNIGLAVSYKSIRNDFFGGRIPFSRDEYASARLSYQADWRAPSGRTLLQAAWTQGLGGTSGSDPLVSRSGAGGGFSKVNLDVAHIHTLDTGLYGVFRASGQWSTQPLYVAEQYAVGGPDTVRGYGQAELLGDSAYVLSSELRWSPFADDLDVFQLAAFVDHGGVGLRRRLPGDLATGATRTGAGFGFRFALEEHANLRVDIGFPIDPSRNREGSSPAVYCGLQTRF